MIDQLVIELQQFVLKVKNLYEELLRKETALNERESHQKERHRVHEERHAHLSNREAAVAPVEDVVALGKKNHADRENLMRDIKAYEEEKTTFDKYKKKELSEIEREKERLKVEQGDIHKQKADIAKEVDRQVKELMGKMKK